MLSIEEHEALAAFAREFGRTWRRELCRRWENGTLLLAQVSVSEAELSALVRLKGKLGPRGLRGYRPPAGATELAVTATAGSSSARRRRARTRAEGL